MFPHTDTASEPPLILGIDVGSSSTRAVLYDAAATLVPGTLVQVQSTLYTAADGAVADSPGAVW